MATVLSLLIVLTGFAVAATLTKNPKREWFCRCGTYLSTIALVISTIVLVVQFVK